MESLPIGTLLAPLALALDPEGADVRQIASVVGGSPRQLHQHVIRLTRFSLHQRQSRVRVCRRVQLQTQIHQTNYIHQSIETIRNSKVYTRYCSNC